MKKFFLIFVSGCLLLISCEEKIKVEKSYHPTGELYTVAPMKDGILDGRFVSYYTNGNVEISIDYKDGVAHGKYLKYFYKGVLEETYTYVEGKREGPATIHDEFGAIAEELFYVNDTLDGPTIQRYDFGEIAVLGNYKKGIKDGSWSFWNPQGEKTAEAFFDMGTGTMYSFHESGSIFIEVPFVDEKKHGVEKYYNTKGKLIKEITYEHDAIVEEKEYNVK
jgi:antitoxin component YwqK of YwqJK toxin-antitoxin module